MNQTCWYPTEDAISAWVIFSSSPKSLARRRSRANDSNRSADEGVTGRSPVAPRRPLPSFCLDRPSLASWTFVRIFARSTRTWGTRQTFVDRFSLSCFQKAIQILRIFDNARRHLSTALPGGRAQIFARHRAREGTRAIVRAARNHEATTSGDGRSSRH